jgi:uncharacterized protein YdeI (BOF family)
MKKICLACFVLTLIFMSPSCDLDKDGPKNSTVAMAKHLFKVGTYVKITGDIIEIFGGDRYLFSDGDDENNNHIPIEIGDDALKRSGIDRNSIERDLPIRLEIVGYVGENDEGRYIDVERLRKL